MRGRVRRLALGLAAVVAVGAPVGLSHPDASLAAGCPARPWTLAAIASVPSLWGEVTWPPAPARRVACFGHERIDFVARGGMLNAVFPGVRITPAFGQPFFLVSSRAAEGWDVNAWLPPGILSTGDLAALERTSPGGVEGGGRDVWWQGSGHFDDPVAADCRPDDGTSTVDGIPLVLTPVEAVELCRNEFVLDRLSWLPVPPTDAAAGAPAPDSRTDPPTLIGGALLFVATVAVLSLRPVRSRRGR
jgi:hypothetical protein